MKYKILIRTAGGKSKGKELGLGHIFRMINLAKELSTHKIFFLVEDFGGASQIIHDNGFKNVFPIKKNINPNSDFKKTFDFILKNKIDLIIFDKYKIDKTYVKKFKNFVKTTVISDLKNNSFESDIVVNGFVGYKNKSIKSNSTIRLLGPSYQILDKRFQFFKKNKFSKTKKFKKLLITVGGFDENKIIELILNSMINYIENFKITIILGPLTTKNKKIQKFEKMFPNNLRIISSTNNMKNEISTCDFGICSGGLTSYEFATLQKPFAIICQNQHQVLTAKKWEGLRLAMNLGMPSSKTISKIDLLMNKLISNTIELETKLPSYLDGKGGMRVAKKINSLLNC